MTPSALSVAADAAASQRDELERRLQRVLLLIHDRGVRGLVIYSDAGSSAGVRYLTGYRPFFGGSILVLRDDGERVLVNTFNWDAPRAKQLSGIDRVVSGFDSGGLVAGALDELALGSDARLGLAGSDIIPFALYSHLFGETRPVPASLDAPMEELRLIKSAWEQEMLRRAATVTDAAIDGAIAQAHAGMTEHELAAQLEYRMKRAGADGLAFPAAVASGPNTERPVSLPTDRRLQAGDLVMVDVGATWEGYAADITRTFVVGAASERQRELHGSVSAALRAAIDVVRPDTPANAVHVAAVEALAGDGVDQYFTHRVGHGIGLETSLERPDLQRDDVLLRPGMTFCVEPGVYIPGFGGVKIEDDLIVGDHGAEVISSTSRDLIEV
jgi:Xaa-Pro aminopeptidase